MERGEFYRVFFDNLSLFVPLLFLVPFLIYLIVNKFSITRNYLDPAHFYFSFTLGTAYAIVLSLFIMGYIEWGKFALVFGYAALMLMTVLFVSRLRGRFFSNCLKAFLVPKGNGAFEFRLVLWTYVLCALIVVYNVGFGFFADINRFEQNKGFGVFVRIMDALRLFIIAHLAISINKSIKSKSNKIILSSLLVFFCIFSSILNGAKFALLESIYAVFLSLYLVRGKLKVNVIKLFTGFAVVFVFAIAAYSINIANKGLSLAQSKYIPNVPFVVEALFLRVLANADKYFLGLPNNVIDFVETKPVILLFLSPLIGSGRMNAMLGYNISDYSVGKQILLYWAPGFDIAGGPTSHFDLFSYVYFGFLAGIFWVIFSGIIIGAIAKCRRYALDNPFYISILVMLWIRSMALLLEPPLGLAYLLDIFIIFSCYKLLGFVLRKVSRIRE